MFCSKCGKQLPDDAKFCFNCGAQIKAPEEETKIEAEVHTPIVDEPVTEAPKTETPAQETPIKDSKFPKKLKPNKKLAMTAIAAALIVVIILIVTICSVIAKSNDIPPTVINAYVDQDGTAYICYDNGKSVKLGGEVKKAQMTPDGKHIVVVEDKGQVYWTDTNKSEKHKLAETGDNITVEIITALCRLKKSMVCCVGMIVERLKVCIVLLINTLISLNVYVANAAS